MLLHYFKRRKTLAVQAVVAIVLSMTALAFLLAELIIGPLRIIPPSQTVTPSPQSYISVGAHR